MKECFRCGVRNRDGHDGECTANCIIIDHFSAFESGLVAPFLYAAVLGRLSCNSQ
jgi:hypothetical protein